MPLDGHGLVADSSPAGPTALRAEELRAGFFQRRRFGFASRKRSRFCAEGERRQHAVRLPSLRQKWLLRIAMVRSGFRQKCRKSAMATFIRPLTACFPSPVS